MTNSCIGVHVTGIQYTRPICLYRFHVYVNILRNHYCKQSSQKTCHLSLDTKLKSSLGIEKLYCSILEQRFHTKIGEATCKYSHLHGDGIIADCSSKSLGAVPVNLPSNLEVLILNNNNLEILRNGDFQECHRLITLTLSNNSLAKVEPLAFENTKNLEELDLRQNNLSFTHDSLPPGIFSSLSKLATLSIQKNQ